VTGPEAACPIVERLLRKSWRRTVDDVLFGFTGGF
jgi:hypothetical protein